MKKIILIIVSIILVTGCSNKNNEEISNEEVNNNITDVQKFKEEYESGNSGIVVNVSDDDLIKYATTTEILDIIKNGTGIIYFGRPTCPWCRNAINILLEVSKDNNIVINYYNPGEVVMDDMPKYLEIKQLLNDYLETNSSGEKVLYIPDVYFVRNGVVIGHHLSTVSTQVDPYVSLTEDEKNELKGIYQNYINKLEEN